MDTTQGIANSTKVQPKGDTKVNTKRSSIKPQQNKGNLINVCKRDRLRNIRARGKENYLEEGKNANQDRQGDRQPSDDLQFGQYQLETPDARKPKGSGGTGHQIWRPRPPKEPDLPGQRKTNTTSDLAEGDRSLGLCSKLQAGGSEAEREVNWNDNPEL